MKESSQSVIQENIEDNSFSNWVRCILTLNYIPDEISTIEISPTDLTALAIIKLFDKNELLDEVFHVFNPYFFNIAQ